jgi:hypothetical protein
MSGHTATQAELRRGERATWGLKPGGSLTRPKMRLVSWKPLIKNSLRGFATIELPIGLRMFDVPVLVSNGKAWASLPSKPQIDKDGQHKRDANGKPAYAPILEWRDRDLADGFSAAVVALIRDAHPEALEDAS